MFEAWDQVNVLLKGSSGKIPRRKRQAAILAYAAGSFVSMITEKLFNWFSPASGREKELENKYA